jgi:hypothetical protein
MSHVVENGIGGTFPFCIQDPREKQKFSKSANVSKNCVQTLTELAGVYLFVTAL